MKTLLIIPPFTQLNSPYASLPFLKGTLNKFNKEADLLDLSIETASKLFLKKSLISLAEKFSKNNDLKNNDIVKFFLNSKEQYIDIIDDIMDFLRDKNNDIAEKILSGNYLPLGKTVSSALDKNEFNIPLEEYAKYLASLFIDDIFIFYRELSPGYELSKYQEKLGLNAGTFDKIYKYVNGSEDIITETMYSILDEITLNDYQLIGISIPFPGNLAAGLKTAKYIKSKFPQIKIVLGGGYINTELRNLSEPRIFEFVDFITLDDGEQPLLSIIDLLENKITENELCRTFVLNSNKVTYIDNAYISTISGKDLGIPSYEGLPLDKYFSIVESINPMYKLWSVRNMNKLRLAQGCYWHKCKFCDTSLPYINKFKMMPIDILIEQIKEMIQQTNVQSFHFVDEAIPPSLAIELSIRLLQEKIDIEWWGNIRLEKEFTEDACKLLSLSGCIAVVAGLESGSDVTLKAMNKGINLEQAVEVCYNFSSNDILVHTYLIYGFPGESEQELINSVEASRQMLEAEIVDSAYWHRFSLTCHSDVYRNKENYKISILNDNINPFANNDVRYIDLANKNIDNYSSGLKKATYNFMLNSCLDNDIRSWFEFKAPKPTLKRNTVENVLNNYSIEVSLKKRLLWLGDKVNFENSILSVNGIDGLVEFELPDALGTWLEEIISSANIENDKFILSDAEKSFPKDMEISFVDILNNELWEDLNIAGLILI
ncbi:MAG: radical SAM protein [Candidatus Delongbacteria bacterium]|nr:radical SAM protein [Candidatus Delongbacteria bacterium]